MEIYAHRFMQTYIPCNNCFYDLFFFYWYGVIRFETVFNLEYKTKRQMQNLVSLFITMFIKSDYFYCLSRTKRYNMYCTPKVWDTPPPTIQKTFFFFALGNCLKWINKMHNNNLNKI